MKRNPTTRPPLQRGAIIIFVISIISAVISFSMPKDANAFGVSPIRLFFDASTKTSLLTVKNEGETTLNLNIKLSEWKQTEDGKDEYADSSDLIFHPKVLTIEKGSSRVIRIGVKKPGVVKEKTYRIYIEDVPQLKPSEGAKVSIAMRFGVPIFIKPLKDEPKGEISELKLFKGELGIAVKNDGNSHFIIKGIEVRGKDKAGKEVFSRDLSGWYLLSGAKRRHAMNIAENCKAIKELSVKVNTDRFDLNGILNVDMAMCAP